jgi:hypothetical protein
MFENDPAKIYCPWYSFILLPSPGAKQPVLLQNFYAASTSVAPINVGYYSERKC